MKAKYVYLFFGCLLAVLTQVNAIQIAVNYAQGDDFNVLEGFAKLLALTVTMMGSIQAFAWYARRCQQ